MVLNSNMAYSAGILIYKDDEIVSFKSRKKGGWDIPKGNVDEGESLKRAAIRETFEETGITMHPSVISYHSTHQFDKNKHLVLFHCNYEDVTPPKKIKYKFKHPTFEKFYKKLKKVMKKIA